MKLTALFGLILLLAGYGLGVQPVHAQISVDDIIDTFGWTLEPPRLSSQPQPPAVIPPATPPAAPPSGVSNVPSGEQSYTGMLTKDSRQAIEEFAEQVAQAGLAISDARNVKTRASISESPLIMVLSDRQARILDLDVAVVIDWTATIAGRPQAGRNVAEWTFKFGDAVPDPAGPFHTRSTWSIKNFEGKDVRRGLGTNEVSASWTVTPLSGDRFNVVVVADLEEQAQVEWLKQVRPRWILKRFGDSSPTGQPAGDSNAGNDRGPIAPVRPVTPTDQTSQPDVLGQGDRTPPPVSSPQTPVAVDQPPDLDFLDEQPSAPPEPGTTSRNPPTPVNVDGPPSTDSFFELPTNGDKPEEDLDLLGQQTNKEGN